MKCSRHYWLSPFSLPSAVIIAVLRSLAQLRYSKNPLFARVFQSFPSPLRSPFAAVDAAFSLATDSVSRGVRSRVTLVLFRRFSLSLSFWVRACVCVCACASFCCACLCWPFGRAKVERMVGVRRAHVVLVRLCGLSCGIYAAAEYPGFAWSLIFCCPLEMRLCSQR